MCIRCAQKCRRPYVPPNLILLHYIVYKDHVDVGWTSLGGVEDELSRLLVESIVKGWVNEKNEPE